MPLKSDFFSRPKLVDAMWGLGLMALGFLGGRVVDWVEGPQRVVVTELPSPPAEIAARFSDTERELLNGLVAELRSLRADLSKQADDSKAQTLAVQQSSARLSAQVGRLADRVVETVQDNGPTGKRTAALLEEVKKLQEAARSQQDKARQSDQEVVNATRQLSGTLDSLVGVLEAKADAPVQRPSNDIVSPPMKMPPPVAGYQPISSSKLGSTTCPPKSVAEGASLAVSFVVKDKKLIESATPVFYKAILVENGKYVQAFEQQYVLRLGTNIIDPEVKLRPGTYEISYGYFLSKELTVKYPRYYREQCNVQIVSPK